MNYLITLLTYDLLTYILVSLLLVIHIYESFDIIFFEDKLLTMGQGLRPHPSILR